MISDWVSYFEGSQKYQECPFSVKTMYLVTYLRQLNVTKSEAGRRLIAAETMLATRAEEKKLSDSQGALCTDMEIDEKIEYWEASSERSRWDKNKKVDNFLELSDQTLFNPDIKIPEDVKKTSRFKQREKKYLLALSDKIYLKEITQFPSTLKIQMNIKKDTRSMSLATWKKILP